MERASSERSGPSNVHLKKRQQTEDNIRPAMVDFDVLVFRVLESYGVYVNGSCIAPSSPEVGLFSYEISYIIADGHTMTYESPDKKKIFQVNLETSPENSMLIPHSLLRGDLLDLNSGLCIKELNEE